MSPEQAAGERPSTAGAMSTVSDACSTSCSLASRRTRAPPRWPSWPSGSPNRLPGSAASARRSRRRGAGDHAGPGGRSGRAVPECRCIRRRPRRPGSAGRDRRSPSVAVLPFLNMSADPENEFFADGITEDVIAHLSRIRSLKVISRASVMPFKKREQSLHEIGATLDVASLLDGSVRRAGSRVRIVATLIDAETDRHLWAETYDRELTDIFAIQTDVALQIAAALEAKLSARGAAPDPEEAHRRPRGLPALSPGPALYPPLDPGGHRPGTEASRRRRSPATRTTLWPTPLWPWPTPTWPSAWPAHSPRTRPSGEPKPLSPGRWSWTPTSPRPMPHLATSSSPAITTGSGPSRS